jgi:hypothetical protein
MKRRYEMARKTVEFNLEEINNLPNNKPVIYKILNAEGENIYTGIAKRGRAQARAIEHLPGGPDPIRGGQKIQIEQMPSIDEAEKREKNIIARVKPKYNK